VENNSCDPKARNQNVNVTLHRGKEANMEHFCIRSRMCYYLRTV